MIESGKGEFSTLLNIDRLVNVENVNLSASYKKSVVEIVKKLKTTKFDSIDSVYEFLSECLASKHPKFIIRLCSNLQSYLVFGKLLQKIEETKKSNNKLGIFKFFASLLYKTGDKIRAPRSASTLSEALGLYKSKSSSWSSYLLENGGNLFRSLSSRYLGLEEISLLRIIKRTYEGRNPFNNKMVDEHSPKKSAVISVNKSNAIPHTQTTGGRKQSNIVGYDEYMKERRLGDVVFALFLTFHESKKRGSNDENSNSERQEVEDIERSVLENVEDEPNVAQLYVLYLLMYGFDQFFRGKENLIENNNVNNNNVNNQNNEGLDFNVSENISRFTRIFYKSMSKFLLHQNVFQDLNEFVSISESFERYRGIDKIMTLQNLDEEVFMRDLNELSVGQANRIKKTYYKDEEDKDVTVEMIGDKLLLEKKSRFKLDIYVRMFKRYRGGKKIIIDFEKEGAEIEIDEEEMSIFSSIGMSIDSNNKSVNNVDIQTETDEMIGNGKLIQKMVINTTKERKKKKNSKSKNDTKVEVEEERENNDDYDIVENKRKYDDEEEEGEEIDIEKAISLNKVEDNKEESSSSAFFREDKPESTGGISEFFNVSKITTEIDQNDSKIKQVEANDEDFNQFMDSNLGENFGMISFANARDIRKPTSESFRSELFAEDEELIGDDDNGLNFGDKLIKMNEDSEKNNDPDYSILSVDSEGFGTPMSTEQFNENLKKTWDFEKVDNEDSNNNEKNKEEKKDNKEEENEEEKKNSNIEENKKEKKEIENIEKENENESGGEKNDDTKIEKENVKIEEIDNEEEEEEEENKKNKSFYVLEKSEDDEEKDKKNEEKKKEEENNEVNSESIETEVNNKKKEEKNKSPKKEKSDGDIEFDKNEENEDEGEEKD